MIRPRFLGPAGLLLLAACAAAPEAGTSADDELVDSRWIGTYRNNAAKGGELRTLALKGDGTAAVIVQECTATSCTSTQYTGRYDLGPLKADERRLTIDLGAKKLAYRSRASAPSTTVDSHELALLELDDTGIEKQPLVTTTLRRSEELWCAAPSDCELQKASRSGAQCIANVCVSAAAPSCRPTPAATDLDVGGAVGGLPGAPSGRVYHAATWTSRGLFVFGGEGEDGAELADGGVFDPTTSTWQPLATAGAPSARSSAHAAAIGDAVVVAGGFGPINGVVVPKDAFVYDLVAKSWSAVPVPDDVAKDWWGDLYAVGGAVYRPGSSRLLHKIDPVTKTVTPVADPPEAAAVRNAQGRIEGTMLTTATGDGLVMLVPLVKPRSIVEHAVWRLFELTSAGKWTVADVGLGPIDGDASISAAGDSVVLMRGEYAKNGGSGVVARIHLPSKKVTVTTIGGAWDRSASTSADLFGGKGAPYAVALVRQDDYSELDTLDPSDARFAHRGWFGGLTPPPRPKLPRLLGEAAVWNGTQLVVWGGRSREVVNGFEVITYPRNVVRYTPSECK